MGRLVGAKRKRNNLLSTMKKITNKGFTVVEVLIASLVFTTLLLLCMEGITRIAKVYVKNSSITKANEFSKSFIGDITQQIRYGAEPKFTPGNPSFLCVSDTSYKISLNGSDGDSPSTDALLKKSYTGCDSGYTGLDFNVDSQKIAPSNIRILKFNLANTGTPITPVWNIDMRVALGAKDLLVDSTNKVLTDSTANYSEAVCRGGIAGSEFCAVISISTSATRRMR